MENLHSTLCSLLGVSPNSDPLTEIKRLKQIESRYQQIKRVVAERPSESGEEAKVGGQDRSPAGST